MLRDPTASPGLQLDALPKLEAFQTLAVACALLTSLEKTWIDIRKNKEFLSHNSMVLFSIRSLLNLEVDFLWSNVLFIHRILTLKFQNCNF
jgi:hypothetical protein